MRGMRHFIYSCERMALAIDATEKHAFSFSNPATSRRYHLSSAVREYPCSFCWMQRSRTRFLRQDFVDRIHILLLKIRLFIFRSQAGVSNGEGGGIAAAKAIVAGEGVRGLYTGYLSNIAYAFPADAIKFLVRPPLGGL